MWNRDTNTKVIRNGQVDYSINSYYAFNHENLIKPFQRLWRFKVREGSFQALLARLQPRYRNSEAKTVSLPSELFASLTSGGCSGLLRSEVAVFSPRCPKHPSKKTIICCMNITLKYFPSFKYAATLFNIYYVCETFKWGLINCK